ncbi:uncharacterized protein [Cicer arietinum]|uniref:Uncharacterized protein LOC101508916 n=1 Tax=Cicer arietinum TaxID=3827 RepID=A0A1S2XJU0_CICAR|nr:uncharacterized protein LOC101508916 [Cicer arietinum]
MSTLPKTSDVDNEDMQEIAFANNARFCSWIPCFSSETSPSWWEPVQSPVKSPENKAKWWFRGWMKVREWSEVIAGPKWKTFIRRFNKNRNVYVKQGSLNYDPLSYALNFDDGNVGDDGISYGYGGFSARFASVPASAKSSMDIGKDAPSVA